MGRRVVDMTGKRYGMLTCLSQNGRNVDGHIMWTFECDCGNVKTIIGNDVRQGKSTSCGCYHKKLMKGNRHHKGKKVTV